MLDFKITSVGRLFHWTPLTAAARSFADRRWPYGARNTMRGVDAGQLMGLSDCGAAILEASRQGLGLEFPRSALAAFSPTTKAA